jgi:hypothetical protein
MITCARHTWDRWRDEMPHDFNPVNEKTTGDVRTVAVVIPVTTGIQANDD